MPGYTHLQRAQPVTLGHYLCAYAMMLVRDAGRLSDARVRLNQCPLGACALAGTTFPTDRAMTARELGFDGPCLNSLDAVSDRDFCVELMADLSLLMAHLSRFSEELVLWSSLEFHFVTLPEGFVTGSSIMPQKKNPDMAELIRGKTGRVYGDLTTMLTVLKGLPLAYNKDLQEDKEAVFDALDTAKLCLTVMAPMIGGMTVHEDSMRKAAGTGFINATDCADWLVAHGVPFREAYGIAAGLVHAGTPLEDVTLEEYKKACPVFDETIYEAINLDNCVKRRNLPVAEQIAFLDEFLKK
jgi:argininosuccinate lyase